MFKAEYYSAYAANAVTTSGIHTVPTIAEMVRKQPDPYAAAIEVFSRREPDRLNRKITFWFADDSSLPFQITYTPIDEETNDENV